MLTQITGAKLESIKNLLLAQNAINPIVTAMVKKVTPVSDLKIIRKTELKSYLYYIGKSTDTDAVVLKTRPLRFLKAHIDALEAELSEDLPVAATARHSFVLIKHAGKQVGGSDFTIDENDKVFLVTAGGDKVRRRFLLRNHRNAKISDVIDSVEQRLTTEAIDVSTVVPANLTIPLGSVQEIKAALVLALDPEGEILFPEDIHIAETHFKLGYGYKATLSNTSLVLFGSIEFKIGEPEIPVEIAGEGRRVDRYKLSDSTLFLVREAGISLEDGEKITDVSYEDKVGIITPSAPFVYNTTHPNMATWVMDIPDSVEYTNVVIKTTAKVIKIRLTDIPAEYNFLMTPPKNSFNIAPDTGATWEDAGLPADSKYVLRSSLTNEELISDRVDYGIGLKEFIANNFSEDILMEDYVQGWVTATNMTNKLIDIHVYLATGEYVNSYIWLPADQT